MIRIVNTFLSSVNKRFALVMRVEGVKGMLRQRYN
jgi:hypothetical protein